mmetsp:Transcript_43109/g.77524  ORF Transcript_43109/g.77524 Transcript_43109/m.77524 type:complete len:291 (-) Transcript_43109:325-1197(-)
MLLLAVAVGVGGCLVLVGPPIPLAAVDAAPAGCPMAFIPCKRRCSRSLAEVFATLFSIPPPNVDRSTVPLPELLLPPGAAACPTTLRPAAAAGCPMAFMPWRRACSRALEEPPGCCCRCCLPPVGCCCCCLPIPMPMDLSFWRRSCSRSRSPDSVDIGTAGPVDGLVAVGPPVAPPTLLPPTTPPTSFCTVFPMAALTSAAALPSVPSLGGTHEMKLGGLFMNSSINTSLAMKAESSTTMPPFPGKSTEPRVPPVVRTSWSCPAVDGAVLSVPAPCLPPSPLPCMPPSFP